ncbi:hypothetical protein AB1Y20_012945 [Prymnesium parvum]|uniref:acylaminoacyl-peptidase n=1 Tax=Prymnesium parvum TaxID=97485 RepID=A0AB34IMS8_PRYPA
MPLTPPALPKLHEALFAGPLGRKYTATLSPRAEDLLLALTWSQPELQTGSSSPHCRLFAAGPRGAVEVAPAFQLDPAVKSTVKFKPDSAAAELEVRLSSCTAKEGNSAVAEIWSAGVRLARRSLADKAGGTVLPTAIFGRPAFSPSGQRVAWIAERADTRQKVSGYWPPPKDGAAEKDEKESARPFGKFEMRRNLGETIGVGGSVIVCWDWQSDSIKVLEAAPLLPPGTLGASEAAVPAQLQFDGSEDGLIFGCHLLPSRLPGLSACLNRRSALFHYILSSEGASCLTDGLYSAMMPRLSPDGRVLAFVAIPDAFGSHATNVEVRTMEWPRDTAASAREARVVVPKVARANADDGFTGFCGFHPQLDGLAWLGARDSPMATSLIFPSINNAEHTVFVCEDTAPTPSTSSASAPRRLTPPSFVDGSTELLAAGYDAFVVQCSALNRPITVWMCALNAHGVVWHLIADAADTKSLPPAAAGASQEISSQVEQLSSAQVTRVRLPHDQGGAEALLVLPKDAKDGASFPWVLRPHGGPHSSALNAFSLQDALLVASGVALIMPNYRGSIGYGDEFIDALLGHAGEMDVDDCAALVRLALETHPSLLDPSRGACYGGSHGGFLTAWLLGAPRHKSLFKCGALWNPVVDLPAMLGTTDIPEWCAAEAYASCELKWPVSSAQYAKLQKASPISMVNEVTVPVLMLLGLGDKRVPPSQGLQFVAALLEQPNAPQVDCLEYAGEGHAIAGTEAQAHAVQSVVSWLVGQLRPTDAPSSVD